MQDDYITILTNDYLKNSGIVGMMTLLKSDDAAIEGQEYFVEGNKLIIKKEYLLNADLTQLYFNCMIERFEKDTTIYRINQKIKNMLNNKDKISDPSFEKVVKEDIVFISEKLASASFKTGIDTIKGKVEDIQIYYDVINKSFKNQPIDNELLNQLKQLQMFLSSPLVNETLCFKNIIYKYINKFWNRSFLLRNNAKKDMKECFENDFVAPLKEYLKLDKSKMKDQCVDCGNPINNKTGVSISFMNDFADDLVRKRSALYNFNVDMNLCPICTFLYALTPLGFIKYHNDFLFFNDNSSIQKLCDSNSDGGKNNEDEVKENSKLEGKYYKIYQYIENAILYSTKDNINRNIQVITRKTLDNGEIRYEFDILDGYLIKTLNHKRIKKNLEYFATVNVIKMKDEYLSLFKEVLIRFLSKRNFYDLIDLLIKRNLENSNDYYLIVYARKVLEIQYLTNGGKNMNYVYFATRDGNDLRNRLSQLKKGDNIDESFRGTVYQLTNALRVNNKKRFLDIIIRLYTTLGAPIPQTVSSIISNENGEEIAYAFLLGLKGAFYDSKKEQEDIADE
ncbi:Cas8a1 family CRISPR/Cas system-associated protein [Longibaculum muris]|uniref:Cas8a1 family CRISPR/Cas system-associated protein n=1 Tax=Longibaculum muris TaxID=1796628 RepID=UPI0018A11ED2|nr:Cas8a1 family CRISPR/Cas system-associated protein [Longibaculum muris]